MALITTSKSLGWYGVHTNQDCTPFKLHEQFGTYTARPDHFRLVNLHYQKVKHRKYQYGLCYQMVVHEPWSLTSRKEI